MGQIVKVIILPVRRPNVRTEEPLDQLALALKGSSMLIGVSPKGQIRVAWRKPCTLGEVTS